MMSTIRTATCHCGDLRLSCKGEPREVRVCHCLDRPLRGSDAAAMTGVVRPCDLGDRALAAWLRRRSGLAHP